MKKKIMEEDRIKKMIEMLSAKEGSETPEDEMNETSEEQAIEDKYGIEKHGSSNHSSQEKIESKFGVEPNDMESGSESGPEDPTTGEDDMPKHKAGLFSKHPKMVHIMVALGHNSKR